MRPSSRPDESLQPTLSGLLDEIETELRRLGFLQGPNMPPIEVSSAFGHGQIAFEEWLARVFLPRAREAVASGHLPATSQVAVAAVRNLDGMDDASALVGHLGAFDAAINEFARRAKA